MGVFMLLFQSNTSQWINKLQAPYLRQNNANYLVYYRWKNIVIIKTFNESKRRKSRTGCELDLQLITMNKLLYN